MTLRKIGVFVNMDNGGGAAATKHMIAKVSQ